MSALDIFTYIVFPIFYLFGSIKSALLFRKILKIEKVLEVDTTGNKILIYIICIFFSWFSYIALTDVLENAPNS